MPSAEVTSHSEPWRGDWTPTHTRTRTHNRMKDDRLYNNSQQMAIELRWVSPWGHSIEQGRYCPCPEELAVRETAMGDSQAKRTKLWSQPPGVKPCSYLA